MKRQLSRTPASGLLAVLLCSAIACAGKKDASPLPATDPPLSAPLLTPGCGSVTVALDPGAAGGATTRFRVERSTDSGRTWATVATVPASPSPASATLADQPSQALQFRYFAADGEHENGPSPVATIVPFAAPDAPTGVDALPGSSRATVTWRLPASDHGSPFTLAILADERGIGNRFQFPVEASATRAVVGDADHPLVTLPGDAWSFRISATNQCGAAISDRSRAIQTDPWNLTPTDKPVALGTTLFATATAQIDGTQYLIGGADDQLQIQGVTLRTRPDPATPEDGRLLPWQESGNLNVPRRSLAAAARRAVGGDAWLYAVGGRGLGFQLTAAVEAGIVRSDGSVDWSIAPEVAGAPLSQRRANAAAFVHGEFLYVLGGVVADVDSGVESLSRDVLMTRINPDGTLPQDAVVDDQVAPAWRRAGTTPPGFHSDHRSDAAAVVVGDYLFVIGGHGLQEELEFPFVAPLNTVHRIKFRDDGTFDCPTSCNWVPMPEVTDAAGLPFPVAAGSAFVHDRRLYYVGGVGVLDRGPVLVADLSRDEKGNPVTGTWTELPTFSIPPAFGGEVDRLLPGVFTLGSFLYVAGGLSFRGEDLIPTVLGDSLFAHLSSDGRIGP